jgi:glycosyltransferase involved in cell wall biosynthesis
LNSNDLAIKNKNFDIVSMPEAIKLKSIWYSWYLWHYSFFPVQLIKDKLDNYLSTMPALPIYCPSPRVVVIHDIIPIILPQTHSTRYEMIFKMEIAHALKYASGIIADSNSTKQDLVKHFHLEPSRVVVIYPGYDNKLFSPVTDEALIERVMHKYEINEKYILFIGVIVPRKNIERLIKAYRLLKKKGLIKHKLVIAGPKGWLYEGIYKLVHDLELDGDIIFTGYVSDEDLPVLLSNAEVFVCPSLYEGFGIPPLESMACGTPVVVSTASSLPEVVGDAGITVDPYNVEAIAEAIHSVISDAVLQGQMRRKGLERARLFSWEKAARQTLEVLENTA